MEVLLFFVIPIKIKWMALLDGIVFAIIILGGFIVPTIAVSGVNFGWTMWKGLYNAGLLSGSGMGCYANAIAALVSMLNFIMFITVSKRRPLRLLHRRIIIRLCIQQEKHRRIMAADRALMKHFIMPIVKRQHGRGLISHTDLLMEHLSTNVLCVEERN